MAIPGDLYVASLGSYALLDQRPPGVSFDCQWSLMFMVGLFYYSGFI